METLLARSLGPCGRFQPGAPPRWRLTGRFNFNHVSVPLVTFGFPVFNAVRFVRASIESLRAQTYAHWEIIISDNASTDGSSEICQQYAAQDSRIRYYRHEQNIGAVRNFNSIVPRSRGEFFVWCADHDLRDPTYVTRCVEILVKHPEVVLAHSLTRLIDMDGEPIEVMNDRIDTRGCRDPLRRYRSVIGQLHNCNIVYGLIRNSALKASGLFCNVWGSDLVFLGDLAIRGEFAQIPIPLFERRQNRPLESDTKAKMKRVLETLDPESALRKVRMDRRELFRELRSAQIRCALRAPLSWPQRLTAAIFALHNCKERLGVPYPGHQVVSIVGSLISRLARRDAA